MKKIICTISLLTLAIWASGQSLEVGIGHSLRLSAASESDWGYNGSNFQIAFTKNINSKVSGRMAFVQGFNPMSNYSLLRFAAYYQLLDLGKLEWHIGPQFSAGLLLFQNNPIAMYDAGLSQRWIYSINKKSAVILSLDFQMLSSPNYGKYSDVNTFTEIPLGLHYRYSF